MLVYGRNVAKELLQKNKKVRKIIIQDEFSDNFINSLIEKSKIPVEKCSKKEMYIHIVFVFCKNRLFSPKNFRYLQYE